LNEKHHMDDDEKNTTWMMMKNITWMMEVWIQIGSKYPGR
jgi:hypothetical protein